MKNSLILLTLVVSSGAINAQELIHVKDTLGNIDLHVQQPGAYPFNDVTVQIGQNINLDNDKITFSMSGIYEIHYKLNWQTSNSTIMKVKTYLTHDNQVISGSESYGSANSIDTSGDVTNQATVIANISNGDSIQLKYQKGGSNQGVGETIPEESNLYVKLIKEVTEQTPPTTNECANYIAPGTVKPSGLNVFCNGDIDGGGWQLVAVRNYGIGNPTQTINDLSVSQYIDDQLWAGKLASHSEILFFQPTTNVWATMLTSDVNDLQSQSPCYDGIQTTLSEDFLFSIEDVGCNGGGSDYSGIGNPYTSQVNYQYIGDIYSMSHTPNVFNKASFDITDTNTYHYYYSYSPTLYIFVR